MRTRLRFLTLLLLGLGAAAVHAQAPAGLVRIPAGTYTPLYRQPGQPASQPVAAFYMAAYPVTNTEYLAFVREHPQWRRSAVRRLFADDAYLRHWAGDLDLGPNAPAQSPVVYVSWFAARAYATWKGMRLPTTAEWERVAAVGVRREDGRAEDGFTARILAWYSRRTTPTLPRIGSTYRNRHGVYDLHGLVWEWVDDFNTALVTGDSRGDGGRDARMFCGAAGNGASTDDYATFMRVGFRSSLEGRYTLANLGFRVVRDLAPSRPLARR